MTTQYLVKAWTGEEFLKREIPTKESLAEGLIQRRDLVAFAARRRHGKTTFLMNLGVVAALGEPEFIGYKLAKPFRSLLLMLEDDPSELQTKLATMVGDNRAGLERLALITRDDFHEWGVPINSREPYFTETVRKLATGHSPDIIVFDNLSHIVRGDYSDSKVIDELMKFAYDLARDFNSAIIFAAHPKKQDQKYEVTLASAPEAFSEQIMGTSHFINSTGSIWALERQDEYTLFVGGRQRGDGAWQQAVLHLDERNRFQLVPDVNLQLQRVLSTPNRERAWELLPNPPQTFGYREAETLVKPALRSKSSFSNWIRDLRRVGAVQQKGDKMIKASSSYSPVIIDGTVPPMQKPELIEAVEFT